jgi:hypothetical protein
MEPEFITYQKFNDPALAEELAEQLEQHDIAYFVEESSFRFDPSLVMSNAIKEYAVKIKSEDFERVNQLLIADESKNVDYVDEDYYLFTFTDDELMDVITKADEWSAFDVVLARKLLGEHGKNVSDKEIETINEQRIEKLKQPDPPQTFWIVIGYMASLLGGVLGIFIGWHLYSYKKTLPDGERVYGYNEQDRRHGRIIFYLSIVVFAVAIIGYKIMPIFSND